MAVKTVQHCVENQSIPVRARGGLISASRLLNSLTGDGLLADCAVTELCTNCCHKERLAEGKVFVIVLSKPAGHNIHNIL